MRNEQIPGFALSVLALILVIGTTTLLAQQGRSTLKVPDGLAFSEFKGYDTWQDVAVSETKTSVKAILANAATIKAYKKGIPENGKPAPHFYCLSA